MLNDRAQRQQAIQPQTSFIVQAPAGSGKTELLTQRFLVLLTQVRHPEEIIALTFTRKAAAEMRERILNALHRGHTTEEPQESHARHTWQLAQKALAQDNAWQWNLLNNPNRLRILTIDALCASLVRQMPLLSQMGASPVIGEHGDNLYQHAAELLLQSLEEDETVQPALRQLLQHLDNNYQQVCELLIAMLKCREQWLNYLVGINDPHDLRYHLQGTLKKINQQLLITIAKLITPDEKTELMALLDYAAHNLMLSNSDSIIKAGYSRTFNQDLENNKIIWRALATLLLTQSGEFRRRVDKTIGFPATKNPMEVAMKQRMQELLAHLQTRDDLREQLQQLLNLPPLSYNDKQWEILNSLFIILPRLAALLIITFQEVGEVDFTEITTRALRALGDEENPTDLALSLDYRIQHILVDEFQDTSITQFRLLEQLTRGWEAADGRTLFLVGDPMQSIYRFRQAEVGLFLRARERGMGNIHLQSLTLTENFRSQANIVNWVNHHFQRIFPAREDLTLGAIRYSPSSAFHPQSTEHVNLHPLLAAETSAQTSALLDLIQTLRARDPKGTIAILVRARHHIMDLLPALRTAKINYRAVDIESLSQSSIIQDLLALTRALVHPADRIAWLAILRAPWCGLTLADCHALASEEIQLCLWERIQQYSTIPSLSQDGQKRLEKIIGVLSLSLQQRGRQSLPQLVRNTWLALGGPACLNQASELADSEVFFAALKQLSFDQFSLESLEKNIDYLFANPDPNADGSLQIMTMHKAKGLEFDHVILPALERKAANNEPSLLLWEEYTQLDSELSQLLLAPIRASDQDCDPLYQYLLTREKNKLAYETARLFYVACTRAKKSLHLMYHNHFSENEVKAPSNSSLLALLWPYIHEQTQHLLAQQSPTHNHLAAGAAPKYLRRLSLAYELPKMTFNSITAESQSMLDPEINPLNAVQPLAITEYDNPLARHLGIVLHRMLCQIAEGQLTIDTIITEEMRWKFILQQQGIPQQALIPAYQKLITALERIFADRRGLWIFNPNHPLAVNEFALTLKTRNGVKTLIIDRSFVDEDNKRWIIDYKSSEPAPKQDLNEFLQQEFIRYRQQLEQYARAFQQLDSRKIHLGLYFPMISAWHEWEYQP
ncbi:MAG: UvrD-helicase domain-containing protein [Legionellales bacterium]|nr:UvrD-helicase domain-containing protein [Legionellales bacterium]